METREVADVLGRLSTDARVETAMAALGIAEQPRVRVIDADSEGPIYATDDWLLNSAHGIEFGFEDEAAFFGLDSSEYGSGSMLLTQIYMYGFHSGVKTYPGPMPFALKPTDDRLAVRAKLAAFESKRRSYTRDAWALDVFTLAVGYARGDSCLDFVLCLMTRPPLPPLHQSPVSLPSLKEIVALFGRGWDDTDLRQSFGTLGFNRQREKLRGGSLATFRRAFGLDLGFHPSSFLERSVGAARGPVFSEVVLFRDRILDARRWMGELPFGLDFEDSPEQVIHKVPIAPDSGQDEDFAGWLVWHFDEFSMQVHYSTMENHVLRVRLMAPGVWSALQAA